MKNNFISFIFIAILVFSISCNYNHSKTAKIIVRNNYCKDVNFKTNELINKFYMLHDSIFIDSALLEINENICKCDLLYYKVLTFRKLSLLSIKQDYVNALQTIEEIEPKFYKDLFISKSFLKYRFLAMSYDNINNDKYRRYYLELCINEISQILKIYRFRIFFMLTRDDYQKILKDPLSLVITRYYYYRSILEGKDKIKDELLLKVSNGELNSDFCNSILIGLEQNFLEFNGL